MSTSIVVSFFKWLFCFFRDGMKNSLVAKGLKGAASWLVNIFTASVFCRFLCRLADKVAQCYGKSRLHGALTVQEVEKTSDKSLFYRIYSAVVMFVMSFCGAAVKKVHAASSHSVVLSGVCKKDDGREVTKASGFFIGFFGFIVAVMFCVPHSMWNNLFGFGIAIVCLVMVIYGYAMKRDNVVIRPDKTYLALILFFASLTFSLFVSKNVGDSIRIYVFFVTSLLLCVSVSMFASGKRAFRSLCGMLFACVVITGTVGIVQAILKVEADASLTDLTLNANMPGRVFSTMGNPNNFAQILVLFMPFAFAYVLNTKGALKKTVLIAFMLIPFVALLQTYSRSGWIAFAVAAAVFVALCNRKVVPFMIILCIFAIPLLPQSVLDRILTIGNLEDSSSSYRLIIWTGALEMLKTFWVTGVGIGPGAFKTVYPYYAQGTTADVAHCHMQFLEVFLETGIIGFISFLWLTFTVIKRSFVASSSKDKEIKYYAAAAAASMTSIIFIGFFEYYWFYPRVMFAFFISTGLAVAVYRMYSDDKAKSDNK